MARQPNKHLSRRILVNISRDKDMTKTPRVVWQHELPILELVFGEGLVEQVPVEKLDEGYSSRISPDLMPFNKSQDAVLRPSETRGIGHVFIGDARAEFARLMACYGRHPDENKSFAEVIYGRFQERRFEEMLGKPELEDLPESQLRQMVRDFGHLPNMTYEASDEEKTEASKRASELLRAPHADLVALAKQVGALV